MRRVFVFGILGAGAALVACSSVLGIGELPDPEIVATEAGPADEGGISNDQSAPSPDGAPQASQDAAATDAAPPGCDPARCEAQLASASPSPAGCAEAYCDANTGTCAFRALDRDGDGYRAATCGSATLAIVAGDDCDDTDKTVYPGKSAACAELPDAGVVAFPGGHPQGLCAYGAKACGPNGVFATCAGVKAPAKANCTSSADNDCDGRPDNTECACVGNSTRSCYSGPTSTQGVGACRAGSQTCVVDASGTSTAWGPCRGEVLPAPHDTCESGNDATCNGVPNEGCTCINGNTSSCGAALGARGTCAQGTTTCGGGSWGGCSIGPAGSDTCIGGNDDNCDGTANEGCSCIDGQGQSCGATGTGCTTGTSVCDGRAWPGAWGGCNGNTCGDFTVTMNVDDPCGPQCFNGTTCSWSTSVCPSGYHITSCSVTNTGGHGSCTFDGANGDTALWHARVSGCDGTHCLLQSCTCRHNGF